VATSRGIRKVFQKREHCSYVSQMDTGFTGSDADREGHSRWKEQHEQRLRHI